MNPTLKALDKHQVEPYGDSKIQCGDVIVFLPPDGDHKVTHRVISVGSQGIRTQGDNNSNVDVWLLNPDDILGKVVYVQRKNRRLHIYGGLIGQVLAIPLRVRAKIIHLINSRISSLLHPAYHWLARTGIFRRWLPTQIKTRILSFKRTTGTERQLLMGRYIICRYLPGKKKWQIRRPFRLFVDEDSLPMGNSDHAT
jgi:signal peptidase